MLFNSYEFYIFFPLVCLIYFLIPQKSRYIWLLISSYAFYMFFDVKSTLILVLCTFVTYIAGLFIGESRRNNEKAKRKKQGQALVISISILITILLIMKYSNFIINNIDAILDFFGKPKFESTLNIIMPIGLSFITLQAIGYIIDVYRGDIEEERNFLKFALFISYFPRVISGPIDRAKNFLPQINEKHTFEYKRIKDGILMFAWGMFQKIVIADRASMFINTVFGDYQKYGGMYIVIAVLLCAFRTYADFAGYSLMAMGTSKILGYDLIKNFNSPYFSSSIAEFWKRWHISLGSWFKDYLYIPLGGNRKGTLRKYLNILIVFAISGLWHGASYACIAWGLLYGIYQVLGQVTKKLREFINKIFKLDSSTASHKIFQIIFTFLLVNITSIFLEAGSFIKAIGMIKSMIGVYNPWILFDGSLYTLGLDLSNFSLLIISIFILMFVDYAKFKGVEIKEWIYKQELWFRWAIYIVLILSILVFGIWGDAFEASAFVYGNY